MNKQDLPAELRAWAKTRARYDDADTALLRAAADELERLRLLIRRARDEADKNYTMHAELTKEINSWQPK